MSIGAITRTRTFGDGSTSGDRSTWHTFNTCGQFTVTEAVSGPAGSHPTSTTIQTDLTAPTGSIAIIAGTAYAASSSVNLTRPALDDCAGVSSMHFSDDGTVWSGWESYSSSKTWVLPSGDGQKSVYVQFRDATGNASSSER